MVSTMDNGLLILVCCLLIAVVGLFLICRYLQMMEARKFHSTDTEEFGSPANFVGHPDGAATTAAGGYVLIPPHHHHGAKLANGSEKKEPKVAKGMDPRDPDAWKRHDSQTDSFAERKDDPWKCDHANKPPSATAVGVTVAAPVAVVAGTSGKPDETMPGQNPGTVATVGPDGAPITNEKLVDGTENGEDTVDAAVDGEVSANPLISMATSDDKTAGASLEPKITVVTLTPENPVPAPAPAPAFSTVGFWEAQEAAHNAAKYGDGGGGGGYSSNYGGDASSGYGYGGDSGRGYGDSSYGAGSYGYGSEATGGGGGDGSSGFGDLTNESGL